MAYGTWAYRHEAASFAIYPLLSALGPIIVWLGVGLAPALWCLALTEAFTAAWFAFALTRRRRLRAD